MKVRTLILGLMLSVFLSACQEEEILGPASLKSAVEKVELNVDGDTQTFSIKATRDWTATVSPQDSGFEIYPLSGKGSNDPQTITVKAEGNTGLIRSAVLTFTAAGVNPLTIRISQEGKQGDIYPVSEIRKLGAGAALPSAKLRVQLLSDLSLGNVAQKNLYVQDNTGGIQIRLASYHEFAQGDSLRIDLEGSQLSHFNGLLQIQVDNDKVTRFYTGKPVVAKPVSVKDFMDSKYEGQYISLNGIQVVAADTTKNFIEYSSSTNIMVEAERSEELPGGKRFYIYSYHDDSLEGKELTTTKVPQKSGTIKGIASVNGEKMLLVLTSLSDVEGMTEDRFEPSSFVATDANNYRVNGEDGSFRIVVTSNTEWTLSKEEDADWLTLPETVSGNGDGEVEIAYKAYDSTDERSAKLIFTCESGQISVNVVQKKVEELSLTAFSALDDDLYKSTFYRISGTISEWYTTSSIKETKSKAEGYFKIVDAEGVEVLIYGCKSSISSASDDFGVLGLGIGDFVTLEGTKFSYQDAPRARASYIVSYEKKEAVATIAGALAAAKATKLELSGQVMAVTSTGFVLSDGTDAIYVYTESVPTVAAGDQVDVQGFKDSYGNLPEVVSATVAKTGSTDVSHKEPVELTTGDALSTYYSGWSKIEYVKVAGRAQWDAGNAKLYISVTDTDKKAVPYSAAEDYSRYDGLDITLYGYSASVYEETGSLQVVVDRIVAPAYISLSNTEVSVSAAATSARFVVKSNVSWSVTADAEWIKTYTQAGEGDGTIEVSFDKNTSENDRSATFTIRTEGLADVVVTLIQYKSGATGVYQLVTSLSDITDGEYVIGFYHDTDQKYYALKNAAISKNPTGVEIAPSENTLSDVSDEYVWSFIGDNTNGFVVSASSNYLNSKKDDSQGISVGSDSTHKWKIISDPSYGFMMLNDAVNTDRYLVAYSSDSAGVSFRYYKKGSSYKGKLQLFKFTLQ